MTKMEMLERFYERHEELERKFDAAEKAGDTKAMDACQDSHQDLLQEVRVEGEAFGDMMRLYSEMKQQGNSQIDLSGTYREPEKILETFREFGVTEFTFSSTWSSAIQVAWAFTQMGCTLEGMTEIYGSGRKFMSNEYEKVPAYIFKIN
ncbi:hypothetical protein FX155_05785 [Acidaminococcus fermentans]|uniref:DUF7698 domain-containing protein n=1 Tax=Acidaminococcus fermentans TaxID=905 RepID=A0A6N7W0S3_ACIFE|nr:hypothetical protein [Acidaminococcus fermentans]MSS82103.1 hypothetical protein [Acidaminococcus fermentans]